MQQQEEQARRQWGELNRRMDALDVIDDSRRGAATVGVSDAAFTQWALAQVCARGRERERERGDLVGSHGRWKRPCLQTTPECDHVMPFHLSGYTFSQTVMRRAMRRRSTSRRRDWPRWNSA